MNLTNNLKNETMIIIGGGIAGLSAGCYAQLNGFKTKIFEMHNIPGGLCTSWKRKDYIIDGCLHWLVGAGKTTFFYKIWKELDAFKNEDIIYKKEFLRIKSQNDEELIVYTNMDKFQKHLIEIAPEDKKLIKKFIKITKIFAKYELPINKPKELYNIFDVLKLFIKHLPIIINLIKYKNISMKKFAVGFKNKFLRDVFPKIFDLPDFSMAIVFFHLAWLHKKSSGYPIGGSLKFAKNIEKKYLSLGGDILYNKKINKIIIKNNKAVGVKTENGKKYYSNIILSTIDSNTTFFNMLDKKYISNDSKNFLKSLKTFPPLVQVSFGISRDLSKEPPINLYILKNKIILGGREQTILKVDHNAFDPTMAPKGKSVIKVLFYSDYKFWKKLYKNTDLYKEKKQKIIDEVIKLLENYYPKISEQIEVTDVTTPITYKRYTGNHKGTWEGWLIDTKTIDIRLRDYCPDIKNFYMSGHWVEMGGGIPLVALSSRNIIQIICSKNKTKFKSS